MRDIEDLLQWGMVCVCAGVLVLCAVRVTINSYFQTKHYNERKLNNYYFYINNILCYSMLSNHDIDELVQKLNIPNFKGCYYKDKLKTIQSNSSYIINLNSELDEHGNRNKGSH